MVERRAETFAAVDEVSLVPQVGDRVRVRGPGQPSAVFEVPGDLLDGLRALRGPVLERGQLVDDKRVELLEEAVLLLSEPLHRIGVGDVDVSLFLKCLGTVFRAGNRAPHVRCELGCIISPRAF